MSTNTESPDTPASPGVLGRFIGACLNFRLVVFLLLVLMLAWGLGVSPFPLLPEERRLDPVPVDAIPDYGENQQIVFTEWMGRSPQDVDDQITYPLSTAMLGIPGVKSVRANSMFGFSSLFVIFDDDVEFYWSRSRILEKLASLPPGTLPEGVTPTLGPDATALGQVYWYTLEGRDPHGEPIGGWDLDELREVQDWYVRFGLMSAEGVSEVASIGGFVREYQIDVNPDAMRAHGIHLNQIVRAVQRSNLDVGARNLEINQVEYFVRGIGFVKSLEDLELSVVASRDHIPILLRDVANVTLGPAQRRGALDKNGVEAVGGVVVVRFGENPLQVINNVRDRVEDLSPGLPARPVFDWEQVSRRQAAAFADDNGFTGFSSRGEPREDAWLDWMRQHDPDHWPEWLNRSQLTIVPFYDRTDLIYETLGTLGTALRQQMLITALVVLLMVFHFGAGGLIAGMVPMAVLFVFIAMRQVGVDANIVALSGIAIAIGTMVDMGIVLCENILRMREEKPHLSGFTLVRDASAEVGSAVLTAVATTVVSFLPVFMMTGAEGKLFMPLAWTKTFALIGSILLALTVLPALARIFLLAKPLPLHPNFRRILLFAAIAALYFGLTADWQPLGPEVPYLSQLIFVGVLVFGGLGMFALFRRAYPYLLRAALQVRWLFLPIPASLILFALLAWLGAPRMLGWVPEGMRSWRPVSAVFHAFPGFGREFMPSLDEGSFLFMPMTSTHAGITEAKDIMRQQDQLISDIHETDLVVGKLGRAESPLDPAPIAMYETVITYHPEFLEDDQGNRLRFRFDRQEPDLFRDVDGNPVPAPDGEPYSVPGTFARDEDGNLIPERRGQPFRLWRPALDPDLNEDREPWAGIQTPRDIWDTLERASRITGVTPATHLQPIETRMVMLQTGMRSPFGVKIQGPDLETLDRVSRELEGILRRAPGVRPPTVNADRVIGKPYLEIEVDRPAAARYGLAVRDVQDVIQTAIGGRTLDQTVEGRARFPIRVRYPRELRETPEDIMRVLVPAPEGAQVPLSEVASIRYRPGPQSIKSEDTFLTAYVLFDKQPGFAEIEVVDMVRDFLAEQWSPPAGVSYQLAGTWENQVRAAHTLSWVLPLSLVLILVLLYLQFHSVGTSLMVFSGIFVAWSGGFVLLWLYGRDGFMDFSLFGQSMRDLFQIGPVNLSVAVWVGFLALFGIATDDGVLFATRLDQSFDEHQPDSVDTIREAVIDGACKRVRPAIMTTATTLLALMPVMTSVGKGSDIMVPMAIPAFGGMIVAMLTVFIVPVLYAIRAEHRLKKKPLNP